MTDLSEEEQARVTRVKALCAVINQALQGASVTDTLQAFCVLTAHLCDNDKYPDRLLLEHIDNTLAVFRNLTNQRYRNEDPAVS